MPLLLPTHHQKIYPMEPELFWVKRCQGPGNYNCPQGAVTCGTKKTLLVGSQAFEVMQTKCRSEQVSYLGVEAGLVICHLVMLMQYHNLTALRLVCCICSLFILKKLSAYVHCTVEFMLESAVFECLAFSITINPLN